MTTMLQWMAILGGWSWIWYGIGWRRGHRIGWLRGYFCRDHEYADEFRPDGETEDLLREAKMLEDKP